MKPTIFFDMDGTIADLYGVENWLDFLINKNPFPYVNAKPLINLNVLARKLNTLKKRGYRIGIISLLAKNSNSEYDEAVTAAKIKWLRKHLASVQFDEIHIVSYGTSKNLFLKSKNDILFDDEENNRNNWTGKAFNANEIFETLKALN